MHRRLWTCLTGIRCHIRRYIQYDGCTRCGFAKERDEGFRSLDQTVKVCCHRFANEGNIDRRSILVLAHIGNSGIVDEDVELPRSGGDSAACGKYGVDIGYVEFDKFDI